MRIQIQNWKFLGIVLGTGMLLPLVPIQRVNADVTNIPTPPVSNNAPPPLITNIRELPLGVQELLSNLVDSGILTQEELNQLLKNKSFLLQLNRKYGFLLLQAKRDQLADLQANNPDDFQQVKDDFISSYSNIVNPTNILAPAVTPDDDNGDSSASEDSAPEPNATPAVPNNPDDDDSN